MGKDAIKTVAGLVVIALIVVATFLYGNAQRQAQIRHDQDVKNQQTASGSPQTAASATPKSTPTPAVAKGPSDGVAVAKTPAAGATSGLPATGPSGLPLVAIGAMVVSYGLWRRSRRNVLAAVRATPRS